jgi:predicted NAD/FAD-dependent oxidoreductase
MAQCPPASIAVVGAGVGGCALIAALRRGGWSGAISLWESGRGPGGRTATRRSRQDAGLCIDHGAPLFNISGRAPALLKPLLARGVIEPWMEPRARLDAAGRLHSEDSRDPLAEGALYRGAGGMDGLCAGLLDLAQAGTSPASGRPVDLLVASSPMPASGVAVHYGVLVCSLAVTPGGRWQLFDRERQLLGEADWLVLAGTLLAHPRSRLLLAWDTVPLKEAAQSLDDPELQHGLAALASLRSEARSNLLLVAEGADAELWRRFPFRLLRFDAAAEQRWQLSRLSIQPLDDGRVAVVAHSSAVFAAEHLSVYGSRSSIARQLALLPRQEEETAVIEALSEALQDALADWLEPGLVGRGQRQLMRWGAAFPREPGLPEDLLLCRHSRVGFCGDYVAGVGFGRVEGALRSGERLAAMLLATLRTEDPATAGSPMEGG